MTLGKWGDNWHDGHDGTRRYGHDRKHNGRYDGYHDGFHDGRRYDHDGVRHGYDGVRHGYDGRRYDHDGRRFDGRRFDHDGRRNGFPFGNGSGPSGPFGFGMFGGCECDNCRYPKQDTVVYYKHPKKCHYARRNAPTKSGCSTCH